MATEQVGFGSLITTMLRNEQKSPVAVMTKRPMIKNDGKKCVLSIRLKDVVIIVCIQQQE